MLMNNKLIPMNASAPLVESNDTLHRNEARPALSDTSLVLPAPSEHGEADVRAICGLNRFSPFRFRINVKPGRVPRLRCRVLRKEGAAGDISALTHI